MPPLTTQTWGEPGAPLALLLHGVSASALTFWRVGPWFADHGWRAIAVDLPGHGDSPRLPRPPELADLAAAVRTTIDPLLAPGERIDVLLGHSLGALTAMTLVAADPAFARRLVLEDPPGLGSVDPRDVAASVEANIAAAVADPAATTAALLVDNPTWAETDAANSVRSRRACDARPVVAMVRNLRWDLLALAHALPLPTLLILAAEDRGSTLTGPERAAVTAALPNGTAHPLPAGHSIHRDDFAGYVAALDAWLAPPPRP